MSITLGPVGTWLLCLVLLAGLSFAVLVLKHTVKVVRERLKMAAQKAANAAALKSLQEEAAAKAAAKPEPVKVETSSACPSWGANLDITRATAMHIVVSTLATTRGFYPSNGAVEMAYQHIVGPVLGNRTTGYMVTVGDTEQILRRAAEWAIEELNRKGAAV